MPEYFFTVYAREKGAQAEQAATLSGKRRVRNASQVTDYFRLPSDTGRRNR